MGFRTLIEVKLSGRYRLEAKVADGGLGSVWRGTDEVLDRTVAVKVLHPDLAADDEFRERFRLEALSAARLTHPNIVPIYDSGVGEGTPFVVMEYFNGGTLLERLQGSARLPAAEVARIGAEVCAALEHAHTNGIVHGDIKPSNILFSDAGHAKVSDFGLGARPGGGGDDSGGPEGPGTDGSVRYLSPEQVDGTSGDVRSDLYSLGLVLYEALTGRTPFSGSSELAAAIKRQATAPARPQRLRPDIPRALDDAVLKALQPSPEDRFADAAAMRRALAAAAVDDDGEEAAVSPVAVPHDPASEDSFVKTEGRWLLPALLAVIVIGAVVVIAVKPGIVRRIVDPLTGGNGATNTVSIKAARAYDPPPDGDGGEHDTDVGKAFDGNPATLWETNGYKRADFGGLKDGVGIWFDAGEPVALGGLKVLSASGGWQGTIRTSEDGVTWSAPGPPEEAGGEHVFETPGSHRFWMLWITTLTTTPGTGDSANPWGVAINEIQIQPAPS